MLRMDSQRGRKWPTMRTLRNASASGTSNAITSLFSHRSALLLLLFPPLTPAPALAAPAPPGLLPLLPLFSQLLLLLLPPLTPAPALASPAPPGLLPLLPLLPRLLGCSPCSPCSLDYS